MLSEAAPVRYRFGAYVLSPRRRQLTRDGAAIPLIPKYFDLLVLLVARRRDAVSKHEIFERVWSDVVVSDGALAQAVRTLRRTLGDDSREPRYIRTVSRHGYQFVWPDVVEEPDEQLANAIRVITYPTNPTDQTYQPDQPDQPHEPLIDRLMTATSTGAMDEARDIAERLHALNTDEALALLAERPHHAAAIAVMRDARWNVPGAGNVPLLRDREALGAIVALARLRIADVRRTIALRWASAAAAGALAGALSGVCGGVLLTLSPGSNAQLQSAIALAAIGAFAGSLGAGGVAAGLAAAEVLSRSRRSLALIGCGACGGAIVAGVADLILRAVLDTMFGVQFLHATAAIDGFIIGGAAGAGYALATSQPPGGGIAAPHGRRRAMTALSVGLFCALAATLLSFAGRPLVGGMVHDVARTSPDAQLVLEPLGRLIGEPDYGPVTRAWLGAFEGGMFGCALAWGFTRRPTSAKSSQIA